MTPKKFNKTERNIESLARFSVAPMMDWTDRHCRYFHRQFTRNSLLYTEMVAAAALVRGRAYHLLDHSVEENPLALQLGGSDPLELAEAASIGGTCPPASHSVLLVPMVWSELTGIHGVLLSVPVQKSPPGSTSALHPWTGSSPRKSENNVPYAGEFGPVN